MLVKVGRKIKMVCQVEREPLEPSIGVSLNRPRDANRLEIALQPMDQLYTSAVTEHWISIHCVKSHNIILANACKHSQ